MTPTEILLICACILVAINTITMCIGLYRQHVNHSYVHRQLKTPTGSIIEVGSIPSNGVMEARFAETTFTTPVKIVLDPAPSPPDSEVDEWTSRMKTADPTSLRFMREFYAGKVRSIETILANTAEMTETLSDPPMERFEIVPGSVRESRPRDFSVC